MQVKKFEARSMKEALEMVKTQLGPDAIILSARDNQRSFGLVGEGSVEITAAVSEETLHKKKFVESRMRTGDVDQFQKSSAKVQKGIIDKMVTKYSEKSQPKSNVGRRYADIEDDHSDMPGRINSHTPPKPTPANMAALTSQATAKQMQEPAKAPALALVPPPPKEEGEVSTLKSEIASLREIISNFQSVPQSMVGTHPGADYGIPFDLSFMYEKLTRSGIAPEIAGDILTNAQNSIPAMKMKNRNLVEGWVARHILDKTLITDNRANAKIHVFCGPSGSGKTTAMVKMAAHMVIKERSKVALLTADTFKVGASDQMRIYAQILNVPFAILRGAADWNNLLRYLSSVDVVLVDLPGFSLKNQEEINSLRAVMPPPILNPRVHFVGSAVSKDADLTESARRYSIFGFDDAIFTDLDEASHHGTIYNFVQRFKIPLHGFGIGPRVPDDYEPATRERLLDLIFQISKTENRTAVNLV